MPEPQQLCGIRAVSAAYTTAHSNTGSLTHWARSGIEPATSWFLVGFINYCATTGTPGFAEWRPSFPRVCGLHELRARVCLSHNGPSTEPGTYTMTSKLFITKSNQVFEPPGEQELGFCFFPVSGAHLASLSVYIQRVVYHCHRPLWSLRLSCPYTASHPTHSITHYRRLLSV